MKKLLLLLVLTAFLSSCGSSKWSCKKRYGYVEQNVEYKNV